MPKIDQSLLSFRVLNGFERLKPSLLLPFSWALQSAKSGAAPERLWCSLSLSLSPTCERETEFVSIVVIQQNHFAKAVSAQGRARLSVQKRAYLGVLID